MYKRERGSLARDVYPTQAWKQEENKRKRTPELQQQINQIIGRQRVPDKVYLVVRA